MKRQKNNINISWVMHSVLNNKFAEICKKISIENIEKFYCEILI